MKDKDCWIVKYNETNSEIITIKSYKGQILDEDLLHKFMELDAQIKAHNEMHSWNDYDYEPESKYIGYFKFYFDHVVDGKVVEHYRVDVGDGLDVNSVDWEYLKGSLWETSNSMTKVYKKQNIYEYFGCKNEKDLYEKLVDKNPSVQELQDFLNFSLSRDEEEIKKIGSFNDLTEYISSFSQLEKGEALVFLRSIDGAITQVERVRLNDYQSIRKVLETSVFALPCSFATYTRSDLAEFEEKNLNSLEKKLVDLQIEHIDKLVEKDNVIYSRKHSVEYHKSNGKSDKLNYKKNENLAQLQEYNTFMNHFLSKRLHGFSLSKDFKRIASLLKISQEYKEREEFGIIYADRNEKIIKSEILFTGTSNSALIDIKYVIRNALKNDAENILVFHNHPSGNLVPSKEDFHLTESLGKACKILNINMYDSLVASQNGVYSIKYDKEIEHDKNLILGIAKNIDEIER